MAFGGTFTIPYVTADTYGRVTASSTKTMTMPIVTSATKNIIVSTSGQTNFTYTVNDGWSDDLIVLFVYKNGLYKSVNIDYTISSKTITFLTGCSIGDIITVIFLNN